MSRIFMSRAEKFIDDLSKLGKKRTGIDKFLFELEYLPVKFRMFCRKKFKRIRYEFSRKSFFVSVSGIHECVVIDWEKGRMLNKSSVLVNGRFMISEALTHPSGLFKHRKDAEEMHRCIMKKQSSK